MAFRIQEFKCDECEEIQEQLIANSDQTAEENCTKCEAEPDKLLPVIGSPSHKRHVSWSKWGV